MLKLFFVAWVTLLGCSNQTNNSRQESYANNPLGERVRGSAGDGDVDSERGNRSRNTDILTKNNMSELSDQGEVSENTVSLADFGIRGDGTDETELIQKALNQSVGKTLHIPKPEDYYLAGQLIVPSNLVIVCDPEVVFRAKNTLKQEYRDFEVLFRFEDSENVTFDGRGAIFKMDKKQFKGEFNHLFMINGAKNVTVKNVVASDSGGDGFYIGAIRSKNKFPSNIIIENCTAINNRRQGLSITSGKDILVTNSSFNKTNGTDPAAGLDIEPGNAQAVLQNIRIKDSQANNNRKRGFVVILNRLNSSSSPVDIVFENCLSVGNLEGFSSRQFFGARGKVEFKNCIARDSRLTGFTESSCLASSVKKIYRNCVVENSNTSGIKMDHHRYKSDYYLSGSAKNRQTIGNSEFINCISKTSEGSSAIEYGLVVENGEGAIKDIILENFQNEGLPIENRVFVPSHQVKSLMIK